MRWFVVQFAGVPFMPSDRLQWGGRAPRLTMLTKRTCVVAAATMALAGCTSGSSGIRPRPVKTPLRSVAPVATVTRYPLSVPATVASPAHLSTSPWRPFASAPWAHRLLLRGTFSQLQRSGQTLYALQSLPHTLTNLSRLVRIDLRDRTVRYSPRFIVNPGTLAITPSGIWVVGATWISRNDEHTGQPALYRFNPKTLRLEGEHRLGTQPASAALAPGGNLWLSEGSMIRLVDPLRWHVLQTIKVGTSVLQVAPTPNGRRIYVESQLLQEPSRLVVEALGADGQVLARRVLSKDWQGGRLAVTNTGVWLSLGVAHSGGIEYLSPDLRTVLSLGRGEQAGSGQEQQRLAFLPNGVEATLVGGVAWVSATNTVTCLDAQSGGLLATQPLGHRYPGPVITSAPASLGGRYFGILGEGGSPTMTGITRFRPPSACRG